MFVISSLEGMVSKWRLFTQYLFPLQFIETPYNRIISLVAVVVLLRPFLPSKIFDTASLEGIVSKWRLFTQYLFPLQFMETPYNRIISLVAVVVLLRPFLPSKIFDTVVCGDGWVEGI